MNMLECCLSCGGVIGRDCWNPEECAQITQAMNQAAENDELATARAEIADLRERIEKLEAENKRLFKAGQNILADKHAAAADHERYFNLSQSRIQELLAEVARLSTVTEEDVQGAVDAYNKAEANPVMKKCTRCDGKGYHHGFGEHGHDPDWCENCGGGEWELADEHQSIRAALSAFVARASAKAG